MDFIYRITVNSQEVYNRDTFMLGQDLTTDDSVIEHDETNKKISVHEN